MNKRLRKKLYLKEYREFGFSVSCDYRAGLSQEERDAFARAFLREAIEGNGLLYLGYGDGELWRGGAFAEERYASATEEQRAAVETWLKGRKELSASKVSPLWDLWHGDDPLDE